MCLFHRRKNNLGKMTNDSRRISLAVTHYNRPHLLKELLVPAILTDPRIADIVVVDDKSDPDDIRALIVWSQALPEEQRRKVRVVCNPNNLDCYANKCQAVRQTICQWVVLFDSDNILPTTYLDTLYAIEQWDGNVAYLPTFARPHFDYRKFCGVSVDRHDVARFAGDERFLTALNTANYFFHKDRYLEAWDPSVNPHTADSIYMNYRWLEQGGVLRLVAGLEYDHRVHEGSHYKQNVRKTGNFHREVVNKLRQLT